jgi:antitoxin component HigA of HigAB toxin-antitoxin module
MSKDKNTNRKKRGAKSAEESLLEFKYVDAFHLNPQTGQKTKWVRLELGEAVEEFRNKHNNYNVFYTIQSYRNKTRQEGGGEVMYAPLFFDIDSSRLLVSDYEKTPAKPGLVEDGIIKANELVNLLPKELVAHISNSEMGIPISEAMCNSINKAVNESPDLKKFVWVRNLENSRADAVKIITFFMERFGLSEDEIRVYFSGSKGFHILVDPIVLGIQPDKSLHRFFKLIANYLVVQLGLRSLDTGSIYGHGRMLRMVNSIHHKSGLFKVELTHAELKGDLNEVINSIAKSPRGDIYPPDQLEYQLNVSANEWYLQKVYEYQEAQRLEEAKTALKDEVLSGMDGVPVCVQFVLDRGILKNGDRNKATMALASYYKDIGTPVAETCKILADWVRKIPMSMTSSSASEAEASTISCVKTVYQEDKYHFQCAYIRSLHGEKNGKDYEVIPCAGRNCPAHEDHAIDEEPAEFMHLAQTANAEYTGKKVAFNALVSGKLDTPYIVPKKVRYICHHQPYCEKPCIMEQYSGMYEREFHENDRFLIEATNQNDNNLKGILRYHSHASCNKVVAEVIETENVSELLVVPMAERVKSIKTSEGEVRDVDESGCEYVSRKIYAIGNTIQSNNHYKIEGYVYSHPKNAMATILSQKHDQLEDSVGRFELTEDMKASFKVFQVQPGETLDDRISLIVNDLVENVTLVRERFQPHLAVLLTYHSCLNYFFQGQLEKRGWLETIFVGDSGQAKTQLVANIMEFCGLGNLTSGEGASRTGLVYRLEQLGERWFITWGKYPLSDRKLIAIDEFSELNPEDFGKITEARTTGILRVDRTVNTETNARVRTILLTNPTKSRTLSSFTHGVESLKPLFASPADIRRLDLAVFLQSGDVPKSVLNAEYPKPAAQVVTSEALRDSILWAWSRKANDIEITAKAMKLILKKADELGEKYGYAQDVPLMEPADLRKKVARLAIALAALVHSTDDTHTKVIVNPDHVEAVVDFMTIVYDDNNCRLDAYSARSKEESELTEEERDAVTKALEDLDFGDNAKVSVEIIDLFRRNDILKPNEIMEMLGYDRSQVNARLAILTKHSMIKRTREGLRKLPKFIEYLLLQ